MLIDKEKCTGCMACKNICPKDAIYILENKEGFLYPEIDNDKCIECGLCKKSCPILNKLDKNNTDILAIACKSKNEEERMKSSSGGVFSLISKYILSQNGIVFGARFDENLKVIHDYTENIEGLSKFRGSKYLQSVIGSTYTQVKQFLKDGRKVLFTGTPCQIEGLLKFLDKEYENLYTQDIICHGVPSSKLFEKYLEYKEKLSKIKIQDINFRDKTNEGWSNYNLNFIYENRNEFINHNEDDYMKIFLKDIALRESCYNCNFKKEKRLSDITIADFWGINNVLPDFNDEKGVSAVLINSQKGYGLFENIKNQIEYKEVDINSIKEYNPSFIRPAKKTDKRNEFFEDLEKYDFQKLKEKYI